VKRRGGLGDETRRPSPKQSHETAERGNAKKVDSRKKKRGMRKKEKRSRNRNPGEKRMDWAGVTKVQKKMRG